MVSTEVRSSLREPPGPRGLPFIGSLVDLSRLGMLEFMTRQWRTFGDTFVVQLGPRRMFVVVHPDAVEHVLVTNRENYVKGRSYDDMRVLTGNGLLTLEGEEWRARRRLEQPAFHRSGIEKLVASMASVTEESLARLRRSSPRGGVFEAHQEMMRLTLEVVGETLFGQRLGVERADASGKAFAEVLQIVADRNNAPVQVPLSIPTPSNRRFQRALRLLDEQTYAVIKKARAEKDSSSRPTLLSMLIDSRDADSGEPLDDTALRNEVITLFLAGHETTALLLTWGFTLLGRHPEVVARMREEVATVVGERLPTMEDCQRLTYMRQTIDEILRLRSPTWTVARDTVADDEIAGFRVRRGDVVLPMNYLTHRHPEFWPDPERFDPERFSAEALRNRKRSAYFPFSVGPRMCIGNTFALVEAQVILTMLLQRAEFSMATDKDIPMFAGITMRPTAPVPVRLEFKS